MAGVVITDERMNEQTHQRAHLTGRGGRRSGVKRIKKKRKRKEEEEKRNLMPGYDMT